MVLSLYLDRLLVHALVIKAVVVHLHFVDWNNKWSRQAHYNGNIRLKERPQKRHISDLLSDHSVLVMSTQPLALPGPVIALAHHHEVT